MKKKIGILIVISLLLNLVFINLLEARPKIYISFLWHFHQPNYCPYNPITQAESWNYGFSVKNDVHDKYIPNYTTWPLDAVQSAMNRGIPNAGVQISFSGSLIENLNTYEAAGWGFWGWKNRWQESRWWNTTLGNPRVDLVAFGFHHPLMGLIEYDDIRKQIQAHREIYLPNWMRSSYSKGMFPPENAFTPNMIPALVDEGIQWVFVDNIHFDRACKGYPWNKGGNLYMPNKADQINPDPGDWVQLRDLWAPTPVSGKWGHIPHWAEYIDPATGVTKRIIVVPTERYMGNEDGRGGFGALNYQMVMSQLLPYNTDEQHPILIVLHHDGENYGGGSESYYHSNWENFLNWVQNNQDFEFTTVEDYLQRFPPDPNDVIHVEYGSWSGADNGDPEFLKWNGGFDATGYSPDRNSWAVHTAAKNRVLTAHSINPNSQQTKEAWRYFLCSQTSCYWYWDGQAIWDANVTRACNSAVYYADQIINPSLDNVGPTIYIPQRTPYNPGGVMWIEGQYETSNCTVWTAVYDVSGLSSVKLKYRIDADGENPLSSNHNELYNPPNNNEVSEWYEINMTNINFPAPRTEVQPIYRADLYSATITGINNKLIDYYVEATDNRGNISRSVIQHVYIGASSGGVIAGEWQPVEPDKNAVITIWANQPGKLHWGVNNWNMPHSVYWPAGTFAWGDGKAVETPLIKTGDTYSIQIGPFNRTEQNVTEVNFVFHYDNNTWGQDKKIIISEVVQDLIPPNPPTNLTATSGNNYIDLSWKANSEIDLAGYNIYKSTVPDFTISSSNKINSETVTTTIYRDTNATNGIRYYYKITAVDISGNQSLASNEVYATPQEIDTTAPSTPINFTITNGILKRL